MWPGHHEGATHRQQPRNMEYEVHPVCVIIIVSDTLPGELTMTSPSLIPADDWNPQLHHIEVRVGVRFGVRVRFL